MSKTIARALAMCASTAAVLSMGIVPAYAMSDTNLDATSSSWGTALANQTEVDDTDSMPSNPSVELPTQVSEKIQDDDVVVAEQYALGDDGELKNIETGETVTDETIVGTEETPADPLAKSEGDSFIPVDASEVKEKVAQNGGDIDVPAQSDSDDDAADNDGAAATTQDEGEPAQSNENDANVDTNEDAPNEETAGSAASSTDGSVQLAALPNNSYGAYWGTYNNTPAFFMGNGTMFVQKAKGVIDVSQWQGKIDWTKAKAAGVEGAIIRVGYGINNLDDYAKYNVSECKRLGIPFGVYWYSYAYDANYAADEGDSFADMLASLGVKNSDLSYPAYYDLEQWSWTGHTCPTSTSVYDNIVNRFYGRMKVRGYSNLSVYSYTSYLNGPLNTSNIHSKTTWVAQYSAYMSFTGLSSNWRGWQYSSSVHINGISGYVDVSAFGYETVSDSGSKPTPAQPTQAKVDVTKLTAVTIPNGNYYINAWVKDSSSVDITNGSTAKGARTQLYGYDHTKAQQFTFTRQSDGSYVIKNVGSGLVLDVDSADAKNGATVQQWSANGTKAQRWFIRDSGAGYYLQSALGNWVLDLASGGTANGTAVRLYQPNATAAQKFVLASVGVSFPSGDVLIKSAKNSDLTMDVTASSSANGARIQLYPCDDTVAQNFRFTEVGNGVYQIRNTSSGKLVEIASGVTDKGGVIQQWTANGTQAQRWAVLKSGNKVTFINVKATKAIDIPSGNAVSGAKLQSYTANGTVAQQWTVVKHQTMRERLDSEAAAHKKDLADGTYTLGTAVKSSMKLDVNHGSKDDHANVQIYASNGTKAQTWKVTHDAKGYVTLTCVNSGKVLDVAHGSSKSGANVQQYKANGTLAQKWIAVKNANGTYTLKSALAEGVVLDVEGAGTANRTNVQIYTSNGTKAQQWVATKK